MYGIIPYNPVPCWGGVRQKRNHLKIVLGPTDQSLGTRARASHASDLPLAAQSSSKRRARKSIRTEQTLHRIFAMSSSPSFIVLPTRYGINALTIGTPVNRHLADARALRMT